MNENTPMEPTNSDYEIFRKLGNTEEFKHWRKFVATFQVQRAFNFIKGMDFPEDIKDPVPYMRGGYDMYAKIMRVIDSAEEMLKENKE